MNIPFVPQVIFYDFDGVMTDNRVFLNQDGAESVACNRSDGYAVSQLKRLGIVQVIVSTETNPVVEKRAEKLQIQVMQGVDDKGDAIRKFCHFHDIPLDKSIFVGNDLNDLNAFDVVGFRCAPRDAEKEILEMAEWISECDGGRGVIRDLYRCIIQQL